jgi:hemerythrin-like domain-containing protein
MFNLFKKRVSPIATTDAKTAPGTAIQHNPDLIKQLVKEHRQLSSIFGEIKTAFENSDYKKTVQKLDEFRGVFQAHLLTENVRLYIYLERSFANDETSYELIRSLRREMDSIARSALAFLEKYETIGIDKDIEASFARDIEAVGAILMRRIEGEENTLYPLYLSPH